MELYNVIQLDDDHSLKKDMEKLYEENKISWLFHMNLNSFEESIKDNNAKIWVIDQSFPRDIGYGEEPLSNLAIKSIEEN